MLTSPEMAVENSLRRRHGNFVRVPLPTGGFAFARVLPKLFAFYSIRSDRLLNIDEIAVTQIAFIVGVHKDALKRWPVIGHRPLEAHLLADVKFFQRDFFSGAFSIYVSKAAPPSAYDQYAATAEECLGLEPLAAWDPEHMEERIDDHLLGKKNRWHEDLMKPLRSKLH